MFQKLSRTNACYGVGFGKSDPDVGPVCVFVCLCVLEPTVTFTQQIPRRRVCVCFCAFLSWELFQLWFCYDQRKKEETSLVLEGEIKKQRERERVSERKRERGK